MAKEHGIDLSTVEGTGAAGRIRQTGHRGPRLRALAYRLPRRRFLLRSGSGGVLRDRRHRQAAPGVSGGQAHVALETAVPREKMYFGNYEVQPMSAMRQRIAEHMVASKRVSAHVYSVDEIDMTKVAALRAKSKDEFEKRYETKLTFMPFFVKAAVAGLRAYPTLNASLDGTKRDPAQRDQRRHRGGARLGPARPGGEKTPTRKNILGIQRKHERSRGNARRFEKS